MKNTQEMVRLEYSPAQLAFHFASMDDHYASNYFILGFKVPIDTARRFCNYAAPLMSHTRYSFKEMVSLYDAWIEVDELEQEEQIKT